MIECSTRLYKAAFSIWNELLQPCRRLPVSPGRSLLSPHTVGQLRRFPTRLPPFLISQASRTPARLRWSASHLISSVRLRHLGWRCEPYSQRFSCWERGSRCWRNGHSSFSTAQISFRSTTEAISSCGPGFTAILPTTRPDRFLGAPPLPYRRPRKDGSPQAELSRLHSWQRHQYSPSAGSCRSRIISTHGR